MIIAFLLQAASPAVATVTLSEARAMSPSALADRLLPKQEHGPIVDAIVNGRGALTPPSESVNRVWLVERMVPFDAWTCRSHVYNIEMESSDPVATSWSKAVPTHPTRIEQYDRLWIPKTRKATVATCAAAPAQASGFSDGGLGLGRAASLVEQARKAFAAAARSPKYSIECEGERDACGKSPKSTLAAIDWSSLGVVEQVKANGEPFYGGDSKPVDPAWGPARIQFTFPYAAGGATWVITVDRAPDITAVRMEARSIIYE